MSANTWANLGGTGGAALPSQAGNGGKLLGSDGSLAGWRTIGGFTDDGSRLIPDGSVVGILDGNNVWTGHQRYPASATQMLTAQTDRIVCNRRTVGIAATAPLALTSAATILDGADGQICVVTNVGDAGITLQDQDALASSNLQLASSGVTIPPKGQITLQFNATIGDWVQDGIPGTANSGAGGSSGLKDTTATGMVARIGGSGTTAARVITGVNGIAVANGDGVAGDPQISLPGSSKGDIIVHDGTGNVRQAAGSDGQTLIADSAQSNGLKWATRAVTGANGVNVSNGDWSTGNAATITIPGSSKGDIIVHNGATNTRMPVGADGQTLIADSSQSSGLRWGAAAGGGGTTTTYSGPGGGNPWMYLTTGNLVLANQTVASTANTISVFAFYVDRQVNFTKISLRKGNNVAGATGEAAIYNSAGVKIASTGVIDWSTGGTQVLVYPCAATALAPGSRYYLAWSSDSSSAQIAGASLGQFHALVMNQAALPEGTFFTAAETYASGLPANIAAASLQRINNAIVMGLGLIQ